MSQKGIAHLFLILLIFAGIIIGLYLVQNPAIFKPRASENSNYIYVSPSGDDSNNGSAENPFKTINRAREEVRKINKTIDTDIFVILKAGVYTLDEPLVFESDDSGFNGHYVRYVSEHPTIRPLISGGKVITGWTQVGNVWKANIGNTPIRQLYVDGKRAVRAKTEGALSGFQGTEAGLIAPNDSYSKFVRPEDIEVVINNHFIQYRCGVDKGVGTSLYMEKPCWDSAWAYKLFPYVQQPVFLENAYEFLNAPGEWYHDKSDGNLYYYPKSGEQINTAVAVIPVLEKLIEGKGTAGSPVQNLVFQNLDFAYAAWMEPTTKGYIGLQGVALLKDADWTKGQVPYPANISFTDAKGVWFVRDGFYHLGGAALGFSRGSKDNFIIGNVFNDISAHAVFMGDNFPGGVNGSDESIFTLNNQIQNNYIHDIGVDYQDVNGIYAGFSKGTNISHNEVFNTPYSGISLAFETTPAYTGSNAISKNLVHDTMMAKLMGDGGSIYVKGEQPGTVVSENVIHSQRNTNGGIYLDGPNNVSVTRNIIYNILAPETPGRTANVGGCGNTLTGNYWEKLKPEHVFITSKTVTGVPCAAPSSESNNITITSVSQAPQNIVTAAGLEDAYKDIKNFPAPLLPALTISSPSPSITPSPSPVASSSPSSSPTKKLGDLDQDGDVDIYDFNIFVADYKDRNLRSDLNGDGKVSIFDFNILIQNLGR